MDRSDIPSSLGFSIVRSLEILERTPTVLRAQLDGLSAVWTSHNEGGDTWTPFDVVDTWCTVRRPIGWRASRSA